MNKEVIYLEPEDDITDILTKLQRAEQKLVALVPPKKATMLRSAVNMKLIARAAKDNEKVAVLVTTDPAVVKMAMAAQIPVAKNLQSRPVIPTPETLKEAEKAEQIIEDDLSDDKDAAENPAEKSKNAGKSAKTASKTASKASEKPEERSLEKTAITVEIDEEEVQEGPETPEKAPKTAKKTPKVPSLDKYRKWIILGALGGLALIIVLVWALVFAPAVDIVVSMNTSSSNFNETVSFTTNLEDEKAAEGIFYAEKQSKDETYTVKIEATGEEDRGDKASGTVRLSFTFRGVEYPDGFIIRIDQGDQFNAGSLIYHATSSSHLSWDGEFPFNCNGTEIKKANAVCTLTTEVNVEAAQPGDAYNIAADTSWNGFSGATVSNPANFSGGTSNKVKVISQADVNKAKDEELANRAEDAKTDFLNGMKEKDVVVIDSSYTSDVKEVKSNPEIGKEAKEAEVQIVVSYSVYTIDKTKVEEFIRAKSNLASDQKIYSIVNPYLERFSGLDSSARLKTVVKVGPTITEQDIIERIKGKKVGEAQRDLESINGVDHVELIPSFGWVNKVPTNPDKITVELKVEEN